MKRILIIALALLSLTAYAQKPSIEVGGKKIDLLNLADKAGVTQTADYVIEKVGSTIYARPGFKSGLPAYSGSDAYTVIQAAIDTLTASGSRGTGGGKIHVKNGTYNYSN